MTSEYIDQNTQRLMRERYADTSNAELGELFGCSPARVAKMAQTMGLKKDGSYLSGANSRERKRALDEEEMTVPRISSPAKGITVHRCI